MLAFGTLCAVGCAVTFGPGDYTSASRDEDAAVLVVDAGFDLPEVVSPDGAVSDGKHLLVLAGERDGSDTSTSDMWLAPIDAQGNVGRFATLPPGVIRGPMTTAMLTNDRFFAMRGGSTRLVEHIAFDSGVTGNWRATTAPSPPLGNYGNVFVGKSLLAVGGWDGVSRVDTIQISPFDPLDGGTFGELTPSPTKLPVALRDMQLVTYKDFVYVVGGSSDQPGQSNKVYVARTDPAAGVTDFIATTSIVTPATGQAYAPASPILCAVEISPGRGRLVIAGGDKTDIVLTSAIDEATGTLGSWEVGTKLPGALRGAGCALWNGSLHLIGGLGTSRSDRILRARMTEDGKLGEWELSSGEKLPAPRSSVIAYVY